MGFIKSFKSEEKTITYGEGNFIFSLKNIDYNDYVRNSVMVLNGKDISLVEKKDSLRINIDDGVVDIRTEFGGVTLFGKFKKIKGAGINITRSAKIEELYSKKIHILYPFEYERMEVEKVEYINIRRDRDLYFLRKIIKEGVEINYVLTSSPTVWDEAGKFGLKRILILGAEEPYYSFCHRDEHLKMYRLNEHYWANYVPKGEFKLSKGDRIISPILTKYFTQNAKEKPGGLQNGNLIFTDYQKPIDNAHEDSRKRIPAIFVNRDGELYCERYTCLDQEYANIKINKHEHTFLL